jgi:UDP-N-acetylmuramoyl-L-alanyl-D-glutamate--2,6-diaminopimelate ligase
MISFGDAQAGVELASLLAGIAAVDPIWDRKITGLASDSRQVRPGDLFIAYAGGQFDAREFIPQAIANGAVAVVAEKPEVFPTTDYPVPVFYVVDLQPQISTIAARFYHHPTRHMQVVGVTGTNGKTSCSYFIAQALTDYGQTCGLIGTLGVGTPGAMVGGRLTTPDPIAIQRQFASFVDQGIKTAAMEVSSHALAQQRTKHVECCIAVFTNLSRDHLDYHGDMAHYAQAKKKLFRGFHLRHAIINLDDEVGREIFCELPEAVKGYTISLKHKDAMLYAEQIECTPQGVRARIVTPWGTGQLASSMLGEFNIFNLMVTLTVLNILEVPFTKSLALVNALTGVPGRMQTIRQPDKPTVVIDFAHTPDALEKALHTLKAQTSQRLWCVFGCGGDRDPGKRAPMGRIAEELADVVILTADNPRSEANEAIIQDILQGISNRSAVTIIDDRAKAIAYAIEHADVDDVILIAGKGHETYQEIQGKRYPFSDYRVVQELPHKR